MKAQLYLSFIFLFLLSFKTYRSDDELYNNYVIAINNESTFQYHLVIKMKNLNSGESREICTQGNYFAGALHREHEIDYDEKGVTKVNELAIKNHERYFEFKNDSAMWNLGVKDYSMLDLQDLEKQVNFDSLARRIKTQKKWAKSMDDKEMMMYAHALFNRGILTGENNCMGGTLMYVDGKNQYEK